MKYDVIAGDSLADVANLVNVKLSEGWAPSGGLSVSMLEGGFAVFAQAIVLYSDNYSDSVGFLQGEVLE